MSTRQIQLNYDELSAIAKYFRDESDELAQLHAQTRQRVRDLYKDWVGEGANKFFDEMETEVLPALERVVHALLFSHDTTHRIMRTIHDADEETTGFFKNDFNDDSGVSGFGAALGGLQPGTGGPADFGAGKFGRSLDGLDGTGGPDDFGAKQFEGAVPDQQSGGNTSPSGGGQPQQGAGGEQKPQTPPGQMSSGGVGGSSGGSQGLQGDLKGLGSNLDGGPQQNASVGGSSSMTGGQNLPDHIYNESSGSSGGGDSSQGQTTGGSGGSGPSSGGSSEAAAGVAGAAGLAGAAGAANALKGKKKK